MYAPVFHVPVTSGVSVSNNVYMFQVYPFEVHNVVYMASPVVYMASPVVYMASPVVYMASPLSTCYLEQYFKVTLANGPHFFPATIDIIAIL